MKNPLLYILSFALLTGCAASNISFEIPVPSIAYVPASIGSIVIVDRSLPENSDLNRLEEILTLEGKDQDRLLTQFVLDGLENWLAGGNRFEVVRSRELIIGSGMGDIFPTPLSWETVDRLCRENNADALVTLESYDSDFIITGGVVPAKNLLGLSTQAIASVDCGFRMYDPSTRTMLDEFTFKHESTWDNRSQPILETINAAINKNEAIRKASIEAGRVYGDRITPSWLLAYRDYFRKSKDSYDLEEGARMMELNDWDKAIDALNRAVESGGRKDRGRAAHNLAVVYEILGDLQQAREWTTVAWGKYREKKSKDYGYLLTRRIQQQQLL